MKTFTAPSTDLDDRWFDDFFEDDINSTALGDYGSDFNAITIRTFESILEKNPNVTVCTYNAVRKLGTVIDGKDAASVSFTANEEVVTTFTIIMPNLNLPVRYRNINLVVVDQAMDESIIGRPFLNSVGFNLRWHHSQIAVSNHPTDKNKSCSEEKWICAAVYRGMAYNSAENDQVPFPAGISMGFGKDSTVEIDAALEAIKINAVSHGVSDSGRKTIDNLLKKHRNCFRIKLGIDAPADVPPMQIILKENAKPQSSPQRAYEPLQRDFIVKSIKELEALGVVYYNPTSRWASPALAVPKPGTNKLPSTVDLRGSN